MKAKIKYVIGYGICIAILLWIALSTVEIWMNNGNPNYVYNKANCYNAFTYHTSEMRVVDCEVVKADDTFEVTVEDIKGNRWVYYDSKYQEINSIMEITMDGNKVVDSKRKN